MGHGDCPVELRDSVGRLAKRLKVSLPEKELEAAPQFVSLLDRLSEVVGPSGAAVVSLTPHSEFQFILSPFV